jgi:hypothetical protein
VGLVALCCAGGCAAERPPFDPPANKPLPATFAPLEIGPDCRIVDTTEARVDLQCPSLAAKAAVAQLRDRGIAAGFVVEASGGLDRSDRPEGTEGTEATAPTTPTRRLRVQGLDSPGGARVYLGWIIQIPKEEP